MVLIFPKIYPTSKGRSTYRLLRVSYQYSFKKTLILVIKHARSVVRVSVEILCLVTRLVVWNNDLPEASILRRDLLGIS